MPDTQKTTANTETPQDQNAATQTEASQQAEATAQAPSRFAWPLFWAFFLILALLILFAWIVWRERQVQELQFKKDNVLVLELQQKNSALEAEIAALDALLAYDPCRILELLQHAQNNGGMLEGFTMPMVLTTPIVYVGDEKAEQIKLELKKAATEKTATEKAKTDAQQEDVNNKTEVPAVAPPHPSIQSTQSKQDKDASASTQTPAQTPTVTPPIVYTNEEPAPPPPPLTHNKTGGE